MSAPGDDLPPSKTWPYLNAPLGVFLAVIGLICGLMLLLLFGPQPVWIRLTAAAVLALSLHAFLRGYLRRLTVTSTGVTFRSLGQTLHIPWEQVRRIDVYAPSGAVNGVKYVYVTMQDRPPLHRHEIDHQTVQIQDRPGVLDTLHRYQSEATQRSAMP